MNVGRRPRARRLRSAAGSINSGRHILESRCAERCANDAFSTSFRAIVRRPKSKKVLRSEVTLPPSVNKTIDSRLDGGKHFESNCTCWQGQTSADCEKETISRRSSSTVCTHSNSVVTGDRVGTPWGRHTTKSPATRSAAADLVTIYSQISPRLDS